MQHWDELTIDNFFGPLDLLWNMIKDKKVDIKNISLNEIADQYLTYINNQQKLDIEIASEYLVIAAQLIELKSKKLLPSQNDINNVEEELFDILEQANQYGQIKELTDFFYNKQEEYFNTHSKEKTIKSFSKLIEKQNEDLIDPLDIDIEKFQNIFLNIIQKNVNNNSEVEIDDSWDGEDYFNPIQQEIISPQKIAKSIVGVMKTNKHKLWKIEEVIKDYDYSLLNIICTFLAVLDLVKNQLAVINQSGETFEFAFTNDVVNNESLLEKIEREETEVDFLSKNKVIQEEVN